MPRVQSSRSNEEVSWMVQRKAALCIIQVIYASHHIVAICTQSGHLSSNGECFDIGMTTSSAIFRFSSRGFSNPYQGSTSDNAAGNGCLMRLCPVPLAFHKHPVAAMELSADSARTTHGATAAKDACRYA